MILFDRVYKRYPGGHEALKDISFDLPAGQMAFLTGHSGAGKSTLLKIITLIERPSRGQAIVNNKNLSTYPRRQIPYLRATLIVPGQLGNGIDLHSLSSNSECLRRSVGLL